MSLNTPDTPKNGTEPPPCPVCQSRQTGPFREVDGYFFQKCQECRFVFLDPMPSDMVLDSMYNTGGKITPDFYPKASSRYHRALRIALYLYRFAWRGPVLDVGCGGGFQVEAFRRFGMKPAGLDISAHSLAFARNNFEKNEFYCESFEEFLKRGLKYKLVYSSEVIEHIVDINEYMNFLLKCTIDKGFVYITTPNIDSPLVPENIVDWDVFHPPRHVQFFGPENIKRLFSDYGFAVRKRFRGPKAGLRYLFQKI